MHYAIVNRHREGTESDLQVDRVYTGFWTIAAAESYNERFPTPEYNLIVPWSVT